MRTLYIYVWSVPVLNLAGKSDTKYEVHCYGIPLGVKQGVRYGIRLDIKGFHMPLKACAYRKKKEDDAFASRN